MPNSLPISTKKRARELADAARAGDASRVEALLAAGARADAPLPCGETPLMRAAALGYEDVARVLLDAGADACARRDDGFTPLILAVFFGHERVVRLLLTYGADARARTRLGTTPEGWAAARGFAEVAVLLRSAEAARPRDHAKARQVEAAGATVVESSNAGKGRVSGALMAAAGARGEAGASINAADTFAAGATTINSTRSAATNPARAATDSASVSASAGMRDSAALNSVANVSVRRGGQVPAHPSSSVFRLGDFLRSWQASVGTVLLVLAFGVAVYAVWRGGKTPHDNSQPAQVAPSPTPQTVAQPPAPSAPDAQASPAAQASPDAQGGALSPGMPGAAYLAPNPAGQPYYVAPGASSPGQAGAPSVPAVISESDAPSPEDASRSKRKNDGARDAASGAQPAGSRGDAGRDANTRSDASSRDARTPGSDSQSAPPARQTQPPPAPQPSTTPERGKVIQWPPQ